MVTRGVDAVGGAKHDDGATAVARMRAVMIDFIVELELLWGCFVGL